MARNNKSLADELRSAAHIWVGKTNLTNTDLLVFVNNKYHFVLVEHTEENIILKALKETLSFKSDIFNIIFNLFPDYKELNPGTLVLSSVPSLKVTGDYNETFFKSSIKVLPESSLNSFLDVTGIDIADYQYNSIKVDNSFTLKVDGITQGYAYYDQEALEHMTNVSKYKTGYTCSNPTLVKKLLNGTFNSLLLSGPAGTGKSTEFMIACSQAEIPCYVIQLTQGMTEGRLIGDFVPPLDDAGIFKYVQSVMLIAFTHGGVAIADEFNYASPAVAAALNGFLDGHDEYIGPDGTVYHRHKDFRFIATMNPGYAGTNSMSQALLNRFDKVQYWDAIDKSTFVDRLQFNTGYKNKKFLETFYDTFDKLRSIYQSKNFTTELTYRNAESFLKDLLLNPNDDMKENFYQAFVYPTTVQDLNDISLELKDLKDIASPMISELDSVFHEGTEEVSVKSFDFAPGIDLDDIDSLISDDASFSAPEEEE